MTIILKNPEALSHSYVPKHLPHRRRQYEEFARDLAIMEKTRLFRNYLVLGRSGTGKTVTVKKVFMDHAELLERLNTAVLYTVCSHRARATLVNIATQLDPKARSYGRALSEVFNFIDRKLGERPAIFILDEIDKILVQGGGDELLYYLTRRPFTWVVGISNVVNVTDWIRDSRVKSSFRPKTLIFEPYNAIELEDILKARIEEALENPEAVDQGAISYTAALAAKREGDARYAIDLLATAISVAMGEGAEKVETRHVKSALPIVEEAGLEETVKILPRPHKLLLLILASRKGGSMRVGELFDTYNQLAPNFFCPTLSSRVLADYLSDLELHGFVKLRRHGLGKGKGVSWYAKIEDNISIQLLRKEITKALRSED